MAKNIQKLIQEVEEQKAKIQSLSVEEHDKEIVEAGCKSLQALIKLYSHFKGQPAQQALIKENLLGIYHYLLKIPTIHNFPDLEKVFDSKTAQLFSGDFKTLHYYYATQAQKDNHPLLLEYHLRRIVQLIPNNEEACLNLSQYYIDLSALTNALLALQHYRGPFSPSVFYQTLYCLNKMCHFEEIEKNIPRLKELLDKGNTQCVLLFLKWVGLDNATVFQASKNYQKTYEGKQDYIFQGTKEKGRKVRLAYIGSNFIPHAQSNQFGPSFFAKHDDQFEIYIYSLRGTGTSKSEKQIKEQVKHYIDLKDLSNEQAIERIRQDQIDIIVNCNGHADDRRPYAILCRRVAPIQIDYLGYPGTSGATYIDYYIGDPVSTSKGELERYFTEKLIVLPHTYQVTEHAASYTDLPAEKFNLSQVRATLKEWLLQNDAVYRNEVLEFARKSILDEVRQIYADLYTGNAPLTSFDQQIQWLNERMKKKGVNGIQIFKLNQCMHQYEQLLRGVQGDAGALTKLYEDYLNKLLPPEEFVRDRFIFCSLNHHVKLSRKDIDCWNEILKRVNDSVLVLFVMFSHEPQKNLLEHFDPELRNRIYFVGAAPKPIHLQRLQAMGCILDSFYYGAHTSAGDAIWAQVPVITRLGESMESRVCSSMLHAAGLDELISHTVEEYINCAVKCATDSSFYHSCLQKLKQARHSPLFNRDSYLQHLSQGYRLAWENFCEGNPPQHLFVQS